MHIFVSQNNDDMKTITTEIRLWLKDNGFIHSTVRSIKGTIIIENLGGNDAATIASIATGKQFLYMTNSMTKML